MIRRRWALCLARLKRDEAAFTLLELILGMAITSLVLGAVVTTLYQFNTLTRRQGDVMLMSQQMGNLATVLSRDVISARDGQVSGEGSVLTLHIVSYTFGEASEPITTTVVYEQSGTGLLRTADSTTRQVARHVASVDFGPDGSLPNTVQVTITTSVGEESLPTVLRYERRAVE